MLEMCRHYSTTGHPNFKPLCKLGRWANLKCHSERKDCPLYQHGEMRREVKGQWKQLL